MVQINTELLPMKAHYFLYNGGTAPVWPFMPVLAKQLGFSSSVVGVVYGCLPVLGAVVKPSMGALADQFQIKKTLFLGFIIVTILAFVGIPWIPPLPTESKVRIVCDGDTFLNICPETPINECYHQNIIAEGRDNSSIECQLQCYGNSSFVKTVCDEWGLTHYCAAPTKPVNSFLVAALRAADHTTENTQPSLIEPTPQTLVFSSMIAPEHTLMVKNCLHLKVKTVQFVKPLWHNASCGSFVSADCSLLCNNALITEITTKTKIEGTSVVSHYQFWLLFSLLIFGYIGMAVVVSLGDAICFELLGDRPSAYGNQRLWGSVGWGLLSILVGLILDEVSKGSATKDYKPAIYIMLVILILDIMVSWNIKFMQSKRSSNILHDVGKLLTEARIFVFLLWCICMGLFQGLSWNFLFWYLEDVASLRGCYSQQWMKTLEGLIMGVQCFLGELPCFFFSGWILKQIGHINAMSLVLLSNSIRFIIYFFLTNPWWALPIECLGGFTFGMFYSTMASYASIVAPSGTEATMQGLVGALFEGIGVALGSFIAGQAFNSIPGKFVFLLFGLGGLICTFFNALAQYFIRKRSSAIILHEGDFNRASYASPIDAIDMLEEEQDIIS